MIRRAAQSRAWRKFFRNRPAVAALCVIGVYLLVGGLVLAGDGAAALGASTGWYDLKKNRVVGALTLDKADEIAGPLSVRGALEADGAERRLEHAKFYLDEFRKVLRQADKEAAIGAMRFGERTPAARPAKELQDELKRANDLYKEFSKFENIDKEPEALPKLEELERSIDSLFKPLSGFGAFMHHVRMGAGTDRQGRSILVRGVYSIKVAFQIGLVVAVVAVLIGTVLGASAAYFGGKVDVAVQWLYSTLSCIPDLVLLAVLVFAFTGSKFDDATKPWLSLVPVYTAMCLTFWIGPCRVVRGEVMKLKELEYVQAATALGFSRVYILVRHIIPNTAHLMFISFSLLFISAVKFEVILSFLNLGVKAGPSWGRMIQESIPEVITGNFWQIGVATVLMFFLVLAFNIVSDALQDAFDPKHVG